MTEYIIESNSMKFSLSSSVNKIMMKVGEVLHQHSSKKSLLMDADRQPNLEIDFFATEALEDVDIPVCQVLAKKIEVVLREAKEKYLQSEILIPCDLTTRISREMIQMSENEPCGLRGCALVINFEDLNVCRRLGKVKYDDTVSTHELILTLKIDNKRWMNLKNKIPFRGCLGRSTVIVSAEYELVKRKLYRSNS